MRAHANNIVVNPMSIVGSGKGRLLYKRTCLSDADTASQSDLNVLGTPALDKKRSALLRGLSPFHNSTYQQAYAQVVSMVVPSVIHMGTMCGQLDNRLSTDDNANNGGLAASPAELSSNFGGE